MPAAFRLSVRDLIAFCFPPEDITPGGSVDDLLAGGRAHRARQDGREGRAEQPVKHAFTLDGETVELYGRMDVYAEGEPPLVEEIKLSARSGEGLLPEHRAQAICYAAMAALEEEHPRVEVHIVYVDADGQVLRRFAETCEQAALREEAEGWLRAWLTFAVRERAHRECRDASIRSLGFPYPAYRPGQRELAKQVYTAIDRRKRLFASLPTGTGKSAAVLYPALKAMGEGKTGKLLYLTARNTARQSPLAALAKMKAQGLHARVTVLTAKEKLCPHFVRCHPNDCPRARGHFLRQEDAVEELLSGGPPIWTDEVILAVAEKHCLCPFELALRLCELADVALMDMNYAFDPFAQVKRLFQKRRGITLLVDEAHHAVDRVRESLSGTMDSGALLPFRASFGKARGRKHPYYQALTRLIRLLRSLEMPEEAEGGECRLTAIPQGVVEAVRAVVNETASLFQNPGGASLSQVFSVMRIAMPFLYAAERVAEEAYAILLDAHGKERGVTLLCLLPAGAIAQVTKPMSGAVFFSATLSPLPAMKELLGGGEGDACFSLPSPFPREHLAVVRKRVSTRYADREQSAALVAASIAEAVHTRPGKYIVYFPSYAYLSMVRQCLDESDLPPLWVQQREMTEADRQDFFDAFSEAGAPRLGLCVLGGLFSEGVDLPGDRLIGVVIVGVGLPTPSPKLRAIQECYGARFGDGFGYACRIPAMQKVLQAGGRIIRSETDRGLLVLVDSRYYDGEYASLLPGEWRVTNEDVALSTKELWT